MFLDAGVVVVGFKVALPQAIKPAYLLKLNLLGCLNLKLELVNVVFDYFVVSVSFFQIVGDVLDLLVAVIYGSVVVRHLLKERDLVILNDFVNFSKVFKFRTKGIDFFHTSAEFLTVLVVKFVFVELCLLVLQFKLFNLLLNLLDVALTEAELFNLIHQVVDQYILI